jgi:hypothetical protein
MLCDFVHAFSQIVIGRSKALVVCYGVCGTIVDAIAQ